jgi:hypothetical protein
MRVRGDILWTMMVLVSFLMCSSLTASGWVGCEETVPDEYMDLTIDSEQGDQQDTLHHIHVVGAHRVGANAALPLPGPMSLPALPQRHQPGHWTPLSLACMSLRDRKLLATDQRFMSAFLLASRPECSSYTAFPPYFAKISLCSEQPLTVILRI